MAIHETHSNLFRVKCTMAGVKIFNKGFNYSQDGPGNRLIYHLQGCNMRCAWCSNPEGMPVFGELMVESRWLIDDICPLGAISHKTLDRRICENCTDRACVTQHRSKGIHLSYTEYDTDSILEEIQSALPLFYDGGGVTFSGGEPTLQFEALEELLKGAKKAGIHTAIESNATHRDLERLFPYIDLLILDFKLADEEKHLHYTGISNSRIKENFKKVFRSGKPALIRIPVIHTVNATQEDMLDIIEFMTSNDTKNVGFELLAYHEYGKVKWEQCGKNYTMANGFVSREKIKDFEQLFCDKNLVIKRT